MLPGREPDNYRWRNVEREHCVARNLAARGNYAGARQHERTAAHMHRDHEVEEAALRCMLGDYNGAQAHLNAARRDQMYENSMRRRPPPVYTGGDEICCSVM